MYIVAVSIVILISLLNFVYRRFCVWCGSSSGYVCLSDPILLLFSFFYRIMVNQDEYYMNFLRQTAVCITQKVVIEQ